MVEVRKRGGLIFVEDEPLFAYEAHDRESAQTVVDEMNQEGYDGYEVRPRTKDGKKVYVVRSTEQSRQSSSRSKKPLTVRIRNYWRSK